MKKTSSHKPGPRLAPAALLFAALLFSWGFSGCGTRSPRALDEPPIITSATYQHTLYNGQPQPISAETARPGPPPVELTYFPSEEALFNDQGGTSQAPVEPGRYYVRIRRPEGNGYAAGRDISVEYTIQKALLHIVAEESQSFPYDGSPKPVRASAEPPAELEVRYYPISGPPLPDPATPPREPGVYRVVLSFAGDEHYYGAFREVELSITVP